MSSNFMNSFLGAVEKVKYSHCYLLGFSLGYFFLPEKYFLKINYALLDVHEDEEMRATPSDLIGGPETQETSQSK